MINTNKILEVLQGDLKSAESSQKEWTAKKEAWKSESYGNLYGNEVEGRSSIVSKDIKRQLEWLIPGITDPFLSTTDIIKCTPVTFEDVLAARQTQLLINTQFTRQFNRYNFITKACRVLAVEGTVTIRTGWEYDDEEIEAEVDVIVTDELGKQYVTKQVSKNTKVLVNKPTAVVCRNEDIFIDPTCMDDMDKCQFVVHRYETDLSTLISDGRYKNLKKVALSGIAEDPDYVPEDDSNFRFEDVARKKFVVYEYWGNYDVNNDGIAEPIVCAWVNDIIIRLEDNPYPDKKPPFLVVPFTPIPFQMMGESLAENIGDKQKVKTAITRGILDNLARSNNGQVGVHKGFFANATDRQKFLDGDNFEYVGSPGAIWEGSYNQIPGSIFNFLAMQDNEIESQTGIKSFSAGISGNALGSTSAAAARGAMDASGMRRTNLVRNIAENLVKPLIRKWISYNSEFLAEEEVIRVTNSEFVPIRRDDLSGNIDIDVSIATAESNAAKSQTLSFLLQTIGNTMPIELTQKVLTEIVRLEKMPDLTKQIEEFKQKPDPMQEQAQKLEMERLKLENERLKADIRDKIARANENSVDAELTKMKVEVERAKAKKLVSEANQKDLDFLLANEGIKHKQELEKEFTKAELAHKLAILQAQLGDTDIAIYDG